MSLAWGRAFANVLRKEQASSSARSAWGCSGQNKRQAEIKEGGRRVRKGCADKEETGLHPQGMRSHGEGGEEGRAIIYVEIGRAHV